MMKGLRGCTYVLFLFAKPCYFHICKAFIALSNYWITMVLSEYEVRKQKAETLRSLGIAPYAEKFDKKYTIQELLAYE